VIDPDILRQLAADLDAKADVCYLDARQAGDEGDRIGVGRQEGRAAAFGYTAARIREILNETTEGEDSG